MNTAANATAIGNAMVAASQAGDLEAVLALHHPNLEIFEATSLPYGGVWNGLQGFRDLLAAIGELADLAITGHTVHETATGMVLVMELRFTSRKTGKVFDTSIAEVDRLEDGKVREIDVFYKDTKALVDFLAAN